MHNKHIGHVILHISTTFSAVSITDPDESSMKCRIYGVQWLSGLPMVTLYYTQGKPLFVITVYMQPSIKFIQKSFQDMSKGSNRYVHITVATRRPLWHIPSHTYVPQSQSWCFLMETCTHNVNVCNIDQVGTFSVFFFSASRLSERERTPSRMMYCFVHCDKINDLLFIRGGFIYTIYI